MHWTWDTAKNKLNKQRHGLSFDVARHVFDDTYPGEERWQTIGMVGSVIVIVIHTHPHLDAGSGEEIGRIISARKATKHERTAYEEESF